MARKIHFEPCACGEPAYSKGMCKHCYNKDYHANHPRRGTPEQKAGWRKASLTWKRTHPDRVVISQRKSRVKRADKLRKIISDAKQQPCTDCKQSYPFYMLEFDHTRGKRSFCIASGSPKGWKAVEDEIAKCDIVCANCHCKRTYLRGQQQRKHMPFHEVSIDESFNNK